MQHYHHNIKINIIPAALEMLWEAVFVIMKQIYSLVISKVTKRIVYKILRLKLDIVKNQDNVYVIKINNLFLEMMHIVTVMLTFILHKECVDS